MYYDKIHDDLEQKTDEEHFCGVNILIQEQLPIALAGRGNFKASASADDKPKTVELILNVLPTENETNVVIFSLKENEDYVNAYLNRFMRQDFGIINMIESWMVYGSDHWFLKPSIWEKMTLENQIEFRKEIMNTGSNIASNYKKTVFNTFKRERIADLMNTKTISEFEKFSLNEKKKYTDTFTD